MSLVSWKELSDGDVVEWDYVLERGIQADYSSAWCEIKFSFRGVVTFSRLTGLWITKTSRRSKVLVNEFNEDYFRQNFFAAMQDREGLRIKVKNYMRFKKV